MERSWVLEHSIHAQAMQVSKLRCLGTIQPAVLFEALQQLRLDGGGQSWFGGILQMMNLSLLYSQLIL